MQNKQEISIEVWIIQESLAPQLISTVIINSTDTISSFKTQICNQLSIDPDRYELFLLQIVDSSYIIRDLPSLEQKIGETQIPKTLKVCLKFEDINWDFSKNQDSNLSCQIETANLDFLVEKINKVLGKPKNRLRVKKISVIQKNLKLLLAELKMGFN